MRVTVLSIDATAMFTFFVINATASIIASNFLSLELEKVP